MSWVVAPLLRFLVATMNLLHGIELSMKEMKCLPFLDWHIACFHLDLVYLLKFAHMAPILDSRLLVSMEERSFLLLFFPFAASLAALSTASFPAMPLCPGVQTSSKLLLVFVFLPAAVLAGVFPR
jgi:hypothetical protein